MSTVELQTVDDDNPMEVPKAALLGNSSEQAAGLPSNDRPMPSNAMPSQEVPRIKARLPYAIELVCDEPDTRHYRHPWCFDKNGGRLAERPPVLPPNQPATIASCISLAAEKFGDQPCFGTRTIEECIFEGKKQFWTKGPYQWTNFRTAHRDILHAAMGLVQLSGVREAARRKECVAAILAETSAEWQMSAQASFQCGITITTVYTTLGHEAMLHGLNQTKASIIFIEWGSYDTLLTPVLANCPHIEHIVLIGKAFVPRIGRGGEITPFPAPGTASSSVTPPNTGKTPPNILTLDDLIRQGSQKVMDLAAPATDDLAFIMYTSGSTGLPKGVMLTHRNFVACCASGIAQGVIQPSPRDVFIAYLPLAHILELVVETVCMFQGTCIGYGHPRSLTSASPYIHPNNPDGSDLMALRPTLLVGVPAILDLIKSGLSTKLSKLPGLKGNLVRGAVSKARGQPVEGGGCAGCLLSCGLKGILLKKVKAGLGLQRLRMIISGGAPLAEETQSYVSAVLAPVAQGYGATETTGCTTLQEIFATDGRQADRGTGHVGALQPACELKLVSVAEMGYLVTDQQPRGEILVAGNIVSQRGYFQMPEKTAEDFPRHSDGKIWFHTGDIGVLMPSGALKIIDRKKDLIKLSAGEYVSLGKVEAALKQVPGIGAVVVFARSDKDHCVAIVSMPEKGWPSVGGKPDEAALLKEIDKSLRAQKLAKFEIPTKVKIDDIIWTPESGLVTASLKLQRVALREHYNWGGGPLTEMDYNFG